MSLRVVVNTLAAVAISLGVAEAASAGDTLRVFLLAGQSNAEGGDTDAAEVDDHPPFVGAALPQTDVLFWYENGAPPHSSAGWIALQPELQRNILGPELTFARKVKASIADPIAIIKSTWGGTNLAVDWDPDNPDGAEMYARTMTLLETALAALTDQGIAWTLEAVLWHQGENDMLNDDHVVEYGARLAAFIDRMRTDLERPALPWFVGATSDKCVWGMDYRDNMQELRSQQLMVTDADPLVHFVPASHLAFKIDVGPPGAPHYHFGTEGQLQLGEAYADAYLGSIGQDVTHESQPFCCGFPAEPGCDVRVFVLAGQRTMEGERADVAKIGDYPPFTALSLPQHDVLYRYRLAGGLHVSTDWAPLGPADYLGNFGPELSFGAHVADRLSDPVAIIKLTHSAAVARDWLPFPTDASLPQYDDAIAFIQAALADLEARGLNPVLEAMVWVPGEHDAWWNLFRNEYETNLSTLVANMRADLGPPDFANRQLGLKWLVAELADDLAWDTSKLNDLDARIQTVADADSRLWFVTTEDIPVAPQSPTFGTEGTLHLGRRLAEFYLALCPGDLSGNRDVDFEDLITVLSRWGTADPDADLDDSGMVDFADLLIVLTNWGECG